MRTQQASAYVIGAMLALTGLVFAGQGLGYIPGSFMTGQIQWFWIGSALVLGGIALAVLARVYGPKRT